MKYSNLLRSNLIDKPYKYKTVNLLELREEIIKQEGLTTFDILKGFHGNNKIKLKYDYPPFFENEEIKEDVLRILKKGVDFQRLMSVEKYTEYILTMHQKLQNATNDEELVENLLNYEKYRHININLMRDTLGDELYGELKGFHSKMSKLSFFSDSLEKEVANETKAYLNEMLSKYDMKIEENVFRECLPTSIDLDESLPNDFKNYSYPYKGEERIEDILNLTSHGGGFYNQYYEHKYPFCGVKKNSFSPICNISRILKEKDAHILFHKALEQSMSLENTISPFEYYQELESNPITINRDTETGRITLIDGYKRLLYVSDKNLLDKEVTIRVFEDLEDKHILALLFAENSWKTLNKNQDADFHDRGFLFCLKQRFGVEYSPLLMDVLRLYDKVGNITSHTSDYSTITIQKVLSVTPHLKDIRNYAFKNDHYINDIKTLEQFLEKTINTKYPYEDNIRNFVALSVVSLIGYIRREGKKEGTDLTMNMLEGAMVLEEVLKAFKKKKYTTDTYIENNFSDNKIGVSLFNHLATDLGYKEKESEKGMD